MTDRRIEKTTKITKNANTLRNVNSIIKKSFEKVESTLRSLFNSNIESNFSNQKREERESTSFLLLKTFLTNFFVTSTSMQFEWAFLLSRKRVTMWKAKSRNNKKWNEKVKNCEKKNETITNLLIIENDYESLNYLMSDWSSNRKNNNIKLRRITQNNKKKENAHYRIILSIRRHKNTTFH